MSERPQEVLVRATEIAKAYQSGEVQTWALRGITMEVNAGEFLAIVGPSGSGKTTLLNLFGALDTITGGKLEVFGRDITEMNRKNRSDLRLKTLGFVFQAYNLFPVLSAQENVEFVLELQGVTGNRATLARKTLQQLGLMAYADRRPAQLSGGQQQRVAVARAVASSPRMVLADEPTANLDGENARILLDMMLSLNREFGMTFVFSTHDPRVVAYARRVVTLVDGKIAADVRKGPDTGNAP